MDTIFMISRKAVVGLLLILVSVSCQPSKNNEEKLTGSWELEHSINANKKIREQKTYKRIDFLEDGTYKLTSSQNDIALDERGDYRVLDDLKVNNYAGVLVLMPASGILMNGDTVNSFVNYTILALDRESLVIEQSFGMSRDSAQSFQLKRKEFYRKISAN